MTVLISVCVCTFRRPEGLARLLCSVGALELPDNCCAEIVVVDNDPNTNLTATTKAICSIKSKWPVKYFWEQRSGVSFARNRCLREAQGAFIAFIDDDEWCDKDWLVRLYAAQMRFSADATFGPRLPVFSRVPPDWVVNSGVFHRTRFSSGQVIYWRQTCTANVLMKRDLALASDGFDPLFAASGGEDIDFFRTLEHRGAKFVWCDEAIVYESVSSYRASVRYVLRRVFTNGQTYVRVLAKTGGAGTYLFFIFRGAVGLVVFFVTAILSAPVSRSASLRFVRRAFGDAGKMFAVLGRWRFEYGLSSKSQPDL